MGGNNAIRSIVQNVVHGVSQDVVQGDSQGVVRNKVILVEFIKEKVRKQ